MRGVYIFRSIRIYYVEQVYVFRIRIYCAAPSWGTVEGFHTHSLLRSYIQCTVTVPLKHHVSYRWYLYSILHIAGAVSMVCSEPQTRHRRARTHTVQPSRANLQSARRASRKVALPAPRDGEGDERHQHQAVVPLCRQSWHIVGRGRRALDAPAC